MHRGFILWRRILHWEAASSFRPFIQLRHYFHEHHLLRETRTRAGQSVLVIAQFRAEAGLKTMHCFVFGNWLYCINNLISTATASAANALRKKMVSMDDSLSYVGFTTKMPWQHALPPAKLRV